MAQIIDTWASRLADIPLIEHAARRLGTNGENAMPQPGVDLNAPPALAFVNHGRWIACCPVEDCHGAEYVDDRRPSFFCCECRNSYVGGAQIRLVMPAERPQIEAHLLARADHRTRNWRVGESVTDLATENATHGHAVPQGG